MKPTEQAGVQPVCSSALGTCWAGYAWLSEAWDRFSEANGGRPPTQRQKLTVRREHVARALAETRAAGEQARARLAARDRGISEALALSPLGIASVQELAVGAALGAHAATTDLVKTYTRTAELLEGELAMVEALLSQENES